MLISDQYKINIPIRKILIIQLGDIGDVVWAIPAFRAVKDAYPQATFSVLTREPNGDLLLDDPHIDKVFQVRNEGVLSNFQLLIKLRREKFDLMFDLRADDRGTIIAYLAGAKIRAALYYPRLSWRNRAFTHLVDPPPAKERIHGAAEQSLKIVSGFGIKETTSIPQIFVSETMKDKMLKLMAAEKIGTQRGFITINPFSRWSYKEWDIDKWKQLASFIWGKY